MVWSESLRRTMMAECWVVCPNEPMGMGGTLQAAAERIKNSCGGSPGARGSITGLRATGILNTLGSTGCWKRNATKIFGFAGNEWRRSSFQEAEMEVPVNAVRGGWNSAFL